MGWLSSTFTLVRSLSSVFFYSNKADSKEFVYSFATLLSSANLVDIIMLLVFG